MKKFVIHFLFVFLLASCASNQQAPSTQKTGTRYSLAESFAYERAASIAQVVPLKLGRFTLFQALANKSDVHLLLKTDTSTTTLDSVAGELTTISQGFCNDKKVSLVINQGVKYLLTVQNSLGTPVAVAHINTTTCSTSNFIAQ